MSEQSSTTAEAPTALTPARTLLALCIAERDRITARIVELTSRERALDDLNRQAQQLSVDVAAAEGEAIEKLAISLVAINAKIASQAPARAQIASDMLPAGKNNTLANQGVQENVTRVMAEELEIVCNKIQDLNENLLPFTNHLAGIRAWAVAAGHRGDESHRARHLKLADTASTAIARLCPFARIAVDGIESRVETLAGQLAVSASARAVPWRVESVGVGDLVGV